MILNEYNDDEKKKKKKRIEKISRNSKKTYHERQGIFFFFFLDQVSGSRDILLVEDRRDHGNRLLKIDCKIQDDRWIIDNGSI